ncbi:MAG: prepilin-type N-terminal cleavage/methylation domain-containing protein [Zetaproteobacteria bacterium]|nr:prepilin-type N-terminal cleavage/methylation domain-containing protein [Zetaproteobacteria bacterium]
MKRGFSLIELLVAISIAAILASFAYPQYQHYRIRAYNESAMLALLEVRAAMERMYSDFTVYSNPGQPQPVIDPDTGLPIASGEQIPVSYEVHVTNGAYDVVVNLAEGLTLCSNSDGARYSLIVKHTLGDTIYAIDNYHSAPQVLSQDSFIKKNAGETLAAGSFACPPALP